MGKIMKINELLDQVREIEIQHQLEISFLKQRIEELELEKQCLKNDRPTKIFNTLKEQGYKVIWANKNDLTESDCGITEIAAVVSNVVPEAIVIASGNPYWNLKNGAAVLLDNDCIFVSSE